MNHCMISVISKDVSDFSFVVPLNSPRRRGLPCSKLMPRNINV
jgi:hypothetical protein